MSKSKEDFKEFSNRLKKMANEYNRMTYVEQGEFHRMVHEGHPKSKL